MAGYYELILLLYFKQWMKCVLALESSNMHFVPYTYVRICIIKPGARVRPARAWFLRIASVRELQYVCLCVCMCPPPRLSITSGVMWCDIDPIRLVE